MTTIAIAASTPTLTLIITIWLCGLAMFVGDDTAVLSNMWIIEDAMLISRVLGDDDVIVSDAATTDVVKSI